MSGKKTLGVRWAGIFILAMGAALLVWVRNEASPSPNSATGQVYQMMADSYRQKSYATETVVYLEKFALALTLAGVAAILESVLQWLKRLRDQ